MVLRPLSSIAILWVTVNHFRQWLSLFISVCFKIFDTDFDGKLSQADLQAMIDCLVALRMENKSPEDLLNDAYLKLDPATVAKEILASHDSDQVNFFLKYLFYMDFVTSAYNFLSFNYRNIHAISPMIYHFWYTTDIFRTKTDIPRIFLEHECTFCG